jgi:hypothetical protein
MGLLSKIYERKGKGMRQSGIQGFLKTAPTTTGAAPPSQGAAGGSGGGGGGGSGSLGGGSNANAQKSTGGAVGGSTSPEWAATGGGFSSGDKKSKARDPFDFESSFDASVGPAVNTVNVASVGAAGGGPVTSDDDNNNSEMSPSTSSPATGNKQRGGSPGGGGSARSPLSLGPKSSPGAWGKAFGGGGGGGGGGGDGGDPFRPTPSKRRRVTFAEVEEYSLAEAGWLFTPGCQDELHGTYWLSSLPGVRLVTWNILAGSIKWCFDCKITW